MTLSRLCLVISLLLPAIAIGGDPPATILSGTEQHLLLFGEPESNFLSDDAGLPALQIEEQQKKSPALAAFYSLLLPGMGELYADGFRSGKYFLIAEGALWLTYAAFDVTGNAMRDDARAFAISRAGITPEGKDDQYYVDIGNFLTIDEYNEKQLRDREPEKLYDPAAGYAWSWDSDASRAEYRDQRISSETAYNNRKFVVAAILVNHVASAINAARSAISFNSDLEQALGNLNIHADVMGGMSHPHGILITLTRTF